MASSTRPLLSWSPAHFSDDPAAPGPRMGHVAVTIPCSASAWGDDLVIVHGGLSTDRFALGDVCALQAGAGEWARPRTSTPAPPARTFHSACAIGGTLYLYGGHAWAGESVVKFGDLWALDTNDWAWRRMTPPVPLPGGPPAPVARDFAAMAPISGERLLLFGGLDAADKRLGDAWVFDPAASAASGGVHGWSPLAGLPRGGPAPRYGHSLIPDVGGDRVFMFGGETAGGPSGELWTLRGLGGGGDGAVAWIALDLPGPSPTPRKGVSGCAVGPWLVWWGGRTVETPPPGASSGGLLLGRSRAQQPATERVLGGPPAVMDRGGAGSVCWREEGTTTPPPTPPAREFATLSLLPGGRLLLLGGGSGAAVWADAWIGEPAVALPPAPLRLGPGGLGGLGRAASGLTPVSSSEDGGGEGGGGWFGTRAAAPPPPHRRDGRARHRFSARSWWGGSPAAPEFQALRRRLGLDGGGGSGPSRLGPPVPPPAAVVAGGGEGGGGLTLRAALALLASLQPGEQGFRGGLGGQPGARFIGVSADGVRLGEVGALVTAAAAAGRLVFFGEK